MLPFLVRTADCSLVLRRIEYSLAPFCAIFFLHRGHDFCPLLRQRHTLLLLLSVFSLHISLNRHFLFIVVHVFDVIVSAPIRLDFLDFMQHPQS
jgi:hypothetical protein